jgi:hypothetical protein
MAKPDPEATVRLDLNNPVFQQNLLALQKPDRHAALDTLGRLRQMTWNQVGCVNYLGRSTTTILAGEARWC